MRRLLSLLIALPLCLILAAPASALTPNNGTYKGSGKSTCVTDPVKRKKASCSAKVTVTVKSGKVTRLKIKLANGLPFDLTLTKPAKISSKGGFSYKLKLTSGPVYRLSGRFTSSTKVSGVFKTTGFDPGGTDSFPRTTFKAKRK